ncbi:putative glycoside hydrolase [bacterium]|nr:putative glycoside hydrolase [bacterium]
MALLLCVCACSPAWSAPPAGMLCEWRTDNMAVPDICPEFFWQAPGQTAYRVIVATTEGLIRQGRGDLWDTGRVATALPIAEYAGTPLPPGQTLWWAVQTWEGQDASSFCVPQRFALKPRVLPRKRPHLRAFLNFGSDLEVVAQRYDLTFLAAARERDPNIITVSYCLVATLVVPSQKAKDLEQFCVEKGLTRAGIPERMFAHYAQDTPCKLHVGAERADRPIEERMVPGWDPANDRNGDGRVDDAEFAQRANPQASARELRQARIPIYYWGPPADDFVVNVADPDYQEFIATRYVSAFLEKSSGLFIDTTPATVPAGRGSPLVEFSLAAQADGAWLRAMQMILARIKIAHPDALVTANGWSATPFVIDGVEWENWLNISLSESQLLQRLETVTSLDRRGKVQMCQVNGIYDPEFGEFGVKVPVSPERDQLFGLAAYYLAAGDYTYFGRGQHPYTKSERQWVGAADTDLGRPQGPLRLFHHEEPREAPGANVLTNGSFEQDADGDGKPDGWEIVEPVALDSQVRHGGRQSARIASDSDTINNFSKLWVDLKPRTTYTLSAWIRTEGIGGQGAQVYPYGFEGMTGGGFIVATGTSDWRRHSVSFTTGAGTHGRINFRLYGTKGTAWFDDLALVEGADATCSVYGRDFERGLVLLRPFAGDWGDDTAREVPLPAPLRPLSADGTPGEAVTTVRLRSGEAAVLVR